MSEAGGGNSGKRSQALLGNAESTSVQNASELDVTDISSVIDTMEFIASELASETKLSAGGDVATPKTNAVQLMLTVMTKFTEHIESEFLNSILDTTSSLKDFQEFTDSLKAIIKYLLEQNQLLLKCLADIGIEAEKRADLLQQRLRESAATTRDAVHRMSDCGEVLLDLVNQKYLAEQAVFAARCLVEGISEENNRLKIRNENLDHDLQSLLSIIRVARSTGNWEMDCVTFCDLSPEDVYGTICPMSSSTQHSDTSKSVAINHPAPDSHEGASEAEGTCAMNGTFTQSETDYPSSSRAICIKVPSPFQYHTWPGRWHAGLDGDTSEDASSFWMSRYLTTEDPGEENQALAPRASSYARTPVSLDSFFTPLVPPSKNNEEKWARRRLFPSSPKVEWLTPNEQQPLDAASVRAEGDAQSPSAKMRSLEGTATGDTVQPHHQEFLGAASDVHADSDAQGTSAHTSSLMPTGGAGVQPDRTTYSGTLCRSPSMVEVSTQTEDHRGTFGVISTQTDAELEQTMPSGDGERDQELCSLRERLSLASQEAQSKTLLAMQLQTHLDSSSKQAELMEQALQNLEKKLAVSRQECDNLKKEVTSVQAKHELAEAATKKEQETNAQLRTELQQLSVTVQHLQAALVDLKKTGVPAVKEDSPSSFGPRVHNV